MQKPTHSGGKDVYDYAFAYFIGKASTYVLVLAILKLPPLDSSKRQGNVRRPWVCYIQHPSNGLLCSDREVRVICLLGRVYYSTTWASALLVLWKKGCGRPRIAGASKSATRVFYFKSYTESGVVIGLLTRDGKQAFI